MAVKHVQSATRVLATFEALADHQPVGVGALARVLDDDKSAVQRALMTLAEAGWIRRTPADRTRWEVTTRVLALAHGAQRRSEEHTSELQSLTNLVCRLLLEKKKTNK